VNPLRLYEAGEAGEETEIAVNEQLEAQNAYPNPARCLRVAAKGVDLTAGVGSRHPNVGDDDDRDHDHHGKGDLCDVTGRRLETKEDDAVGPPGGQKGVDAAQQRT
jgi:hypothetical protein